MYKVLLVDNEPYILEGLMQLIDWKANNCEIIGTAETGKQAFELLQTTAVDIVVTDIRMPEMDGLELCEKIRAHYPLMQLIILTGFPDFEYAQAAIKYGVADFILKPTTDDALEAGIAKAIQTLNRFRQAEENESSLLLQRQLILRDLLSGSGHSQIWVLNKLAEAQLLITEYMVLSVRLYGYKDLSEVTDMMKDFSDRAQKIAGEKGATVYFVEKDESRCYLVVLNEQEVCDRFSRSLVSEIDEDADYSVRIGCSTLYRSVTEMNHGAEEADDARRFILHESQSSVMKYEQLPDLSTEVKGRLVEMMRRTQTAFENHNEERIRSSLDEIFSYMQENAVPYSTMLNMTEMFLNYGRALLLSHSLLGEFDEETPYLTEETPEGLRLRIEEQLKRILERLKEENTSDDSAIVQVCDYIDAHYKEALTLEKLAEMVHLSPGYFSRLFKRCKGVNFGNYIAHRRMERAKELLERTDMKIYEVSDEVGIDDPVYFSRLFKKHTGLKPKEFREKVKK